MEYNKHLGVPEIAVAKKTMYKNFPMVPRVIFGKGSFDQLADILLPKRRHSDAPFIFLHN